MTDQQQRDIIVATDEINTVLAQVFAMCEQRAIPNPAIEQLRKQAMTAALKLNTAVARMEAGR